MPIQQYLSFLAYALAATILPGPNNVLLMSISGRSGFRKCLPLIAGIWTGLIAVMSISAAFMGFLSALLPTIVPIFKYAGAAYILYLAVKTLLRKPPAENADDTGAEKLPGFKEGFLLQFLNVKVLMLGLAAYPGYFLSAGVFFPQFILIPLFAVSMTLCCGTGNLVWALLGSMLRPAYSRFYRQINAAMAILLVWCAFTIVTARV